MQLNAADFCNYPTFPRRFLQICAIADFGSLNLTTQYAYDANHNLVQVTTPKGYVWQYGYDGKGNLTSVTDPLGRTTTMTYDEKNNLTSVTTPSGKTTYYAYDQNGNLV